MKKNIVPAIIIIAAILLSTFVIANTPVIPGDATTSSSDDPSGTADSEIIVEGERDDNEVPNPRSNECLDWNEFGNQRDPVLIDAEQRYSRALVDAERDYYDCRGCVYSTIIHGYDCRGGHQPGSSQYEACWEIYEDTRIQAHENFEKETSDAILQNWFNCFEEGILGLFD